MRGAGATKEGGTFRWKGVFVDPDDYRVSTLFTGIPGSGKSKRVERRIVEAVEGLVVDLVILHDSEERTARDVALQLIARGLGNCIHWDSYRRFQRVLGGLSPQPSEDPDLFRREAEDRQRLDAWKRVLWLAADRVEENGKDIFGMASLNMAAEMGSRMIFYQRDPARRDFSLFPFVVQLGSSRCRDLLAGMDEREETREVRRWYAALLRMYENAHYRLLEEKIGALERLVPQAFTPQFRERLGGEFIVKRLMRERRSRTQLVVLDGADDGSVPQRAVTALTHAWNEKTYEAQQQFFLEHGRPYRVVTVWEEMAANRSLGPREVVMLRKGRKLGWYPWGVATDFAFADEATREAMTKLFRRKEWHNPGDKEMALAAGEDMAYRQFNLHQVHSVERSLKQLRREIPRTQQRVTKTSSRDDEGNVRTGESISEADVHDVDTITEERTKYVGLDDQVKMKANQLLGMRAGEFMVSHMTEGKAYFSTEPEYSPMLPPPFDEEDEPGLAERKLARVIERSQASDYFRTPVPVQPCETIQPTPRPKKTAAKSEAKPKVPPKPKGTGGRGGTKS